MLFTKFSVIFLGLAALAWAAPHLQSGVKRRLAWTPRSLKERNHDGNSKDIIDTTVIQLSEQSRNSEVELTILVEEDIRTNSQKKKAKDNIRKNHFRNKNKDVNTIVIVITEIVDIRNSDNQNKRYMKHQVSADNGQRDNVIVQVTEVVAITISDNNSNNKGSHGKGKGGHTAAHNGNALAATAASNAVAAAIQTVDPNAPFSASNQTVLLPSGAPAPDSQNVEFDPAAILEDISVDLFVEQS